MHQPVHASWVSLAHQHQHLYEHILPKSSSQSLMSLRISAYKEGEDHTISTSDFVRATQLMFPPPSFRTTIPAKPNGQTSRVSSTETTLNYVAEAPFSRRERGIHAADQASAVPELGMINGALCCLMRSALSLRCFAPLVLLA